MEVCNLITLSFSGLSLNRPNQTSQPELYFIYHPITSILRNTKANNITQGRYILMQSIRAIRICIEIYFYVISNAPPRIVISRCLCAQSAHDLCEC